MIMTKKIHFSVCGMILLLAEIVFCQPNRNSFNPSLSYYFNNPASNWNEAIPIGNGRLGGMVFGGIGTEKIQTNDDTFWSGEPRDLQKPGTYKYLPEIRNKIKEGKTLEAETLINHHMLGPWNESYMPLADVLLKMADSIGSDYKRELDLGKGVVTISYQQNGVYFKREIFASHPDQCIVIRLTADKKRSINLVAKIKSAVKFKTHTLGRQLIIDGQAPKHVEPNYQGMQAPVYVKGHGMRFEGRLLVTETDGEVLSDGDNMKLMNASSATLIVVAATSFNGFNKDPFRDGKDERKLCQAYINKLKGKKYQDLYRRHVKDFRSFFGRVSIDLGSSPESLLPLNERIKNHKRDPALAALYFQFGRYLMISSSRPGSQPANLQGIWSNLLQPAWSANWTINCNAEINYWPVEVANLSECHLPLMNLIREATVDGSKTAKNLYNSRGWVAHHNLDIWRTTWPVGGEGKWAIFQVGSAWLCQHIWEHYLFTQDKKFLNNFYPALRDATLFYLDDLQKGNDGYLVTNPSVSFENIYLKPDGEKGWACMGASEDMQIIRSLFKNTMAAIDILEKDQSFKLKIKKTYEQLAPIKISPSTGRLQEWNDDWESAEPQNGQVPQGWGLVASNLISLRGTPELANAFRKTIEYRKPGYALNSGSWVGAFAANFWARLQEGDSVQQVIDRHFDLALFPNLTCNFTGFFQIDGNLGLTCAIAETLLQSQAGEIELLPALPKRYPNGFVTGLKARGGYEVDIFWKDNILEKAIIKSRIGGTIPVRYKGKVKNFKVKALKSTTIFLSDFS